MAYVTPEEGREQLRKFRERRRVPADVEEMAHLAGLKAIGRVPGMHGDPEWDWKDTTMQDMETYEEVHHQTVSVLMGDSLEP